MWQGNIKNSPKGSLEQHQHQQRKVLNRDKNLSSQAITSAGGKPAIIRVHESSFTEQERPTKTSMEPQIILGSGQSSQMTTQYLGVPNQYPNKQTIQTKSENKGLDSYSSSFGHNTSQSSGQINLMSSSKESIDLLNCQKKSTLSRWEFIGNASKIRDLKEDQGIIKSFDKMSKSFVIQLTERDTCIRFPRAYPINPFLQNKNQQPYIISADFDRLDSSQLKQTNGSFLSNSNQHNNSQSIDSNGGGDQTPPAVNSLVLSTASLTRGGAQHSNVQILSQALLLQIMIPETEDFNLEFTMLDLNKVRRRLIISSGDRENFSELYISENHAVIPNSFIERRVWLNLVIDLKNLFNCIYRGHTYKQLEGILISSVCKIRRVMTLSTNHMQLISLIGGQTQTGDQFGINSVLPQSVIYPQGVTTRFQLFNYENAVVNQKYQIRCDFPMNTSPILHQQNIDSAGEPAEVVTEYMKQRKNMKRLSPMPMNGVNNQQLSRQNFTTNTQNQQGTISPRQGSKIESTMKRKQASQKTLVSLEKIKQQSSNVPGYSQINGFISAKSQNEQPTQTYQKSNNKVGQVSNHISQPSQNNGQQQQQYSEANTTFTTRKKSIPSATSHTFASEQDNTFHFSSQHKGGSIGGANGTQTINNSSIQGGEFMQNTMRASMQRLSNDRGNSINQSYMQGLVPPTNGTQKFQYGMNIGMTNLKNLKGKKVHPLSAVQRTNKLSNNLYTVVNNKLVRNHQGQQHNTNSSQQNIDKLLTDYETSSAIKISPSPSEERLQEINAALSKTFVKNRSQGIGSVTDANNSFNNVINHDNLLNFEYLNNPQSVGHNSLAAQNPLEYLKLKQQMLRPFNQTDINNPNESMLVRDNGQRTPLTGGSSLMEQEVYSTAFKNKRLPRQSIFNHEYSTSSLPQIDEVSSPQPTAQVSRLQVSTLNTQNIQHSKAFQPPHGTNSHPLGNRIPLHGGVNFPNNALSTPPPAVNQQSYYTAEYNFNTGATTGGDPYLTLKPVAPFSNNSGSQKGNSAVGLNNVYTGGKLTTAMAWHEESIREENEFAENDEGIQINNNNSLEERSSSRSSSKRKNDTTVTIVKERNGKIGQNNHKNKMRTSNELVGQQIKAFKNIGATTPYQNNQNNPTKQSRATGKFSTLENSNIQILIGSQAVSPNIPVNSHGGINNVNRNMMSQYNNTGGSNNKASQQQRYASQVKEKNYNTSTLTSQFGAGSGQMQNSESTKNNLDSQSLTITNLNDKISYMNKKRQKLQEIDNKYQNAHETVNRFMINKSELISNGVTSNNLEPISEDSKVKGKQRVKRAQEANKLLKAYNMDPDTVQTQVLPLPSIDSSTNDFKSFGRQKQQPKQKGGATTMVESQADLSQNTRSKKQNLNNEFTESNNTLNSGRIVAAVGGKIAPKMKKSGAMNASKGAITPVQNIKHDPADPNSIFMESMHHDLSASNLDVLTDNTNPSHRISRQGHYGKIVKAVPFNKNDKTHQQQSTTAYADNAYRTRKDNSVNHQKKQSQVSVGRAAKLVNNTKQLKQQNNQISQLSEEQIRLLKRLNHNFNQTANDDTNDDEEINSMIEEQIERESGAPGTAKSRVRRVGTANGGGAYGKQRTDLASGGDADDDDEYDVDYDNLVVSDILGVSGIPQGLGGVFGTFGMPQINDNHGANGGAKSNLAQSFSLYDFS